MHNMAIALHKKGYQVTGSDDEVFEPSKGRLNKHGLLPDKMGWDEGRVTNEIDCVISTGGGIVIRKDNRDLLRGSGLIIYLEASIQTQLERTLLDKSRPLLDSKDKELTLRNLKNVLRSHNPE